MVTPFEKLEQDALNLPPEQRAFLADVLLSRLAPAGVGLRHSDASVYFIKKTTGSKSCFLEAEALSDIDAEWIAEAERRYQGYKEGRRPPIPADEVFAEADRLLK